MLSANDKGWFGGRLLISVILYHVTSTHHISKPYIKLIRIQGEKLRITCPSFHWSCAMPESLRNLVAGSLRQIWVKVWLPNKPHPTQDTKNGVGHWQINSRHATQRACVLTRLAGQEPQLRTSQASGVATVGVPVELVNTGSLRKKSLHERFLLRFKTHRAL